MKRIRLTVAYDGTAYCGFQLQPDLPTVEGELNRALSELTGETVTVIGASRTDSGVHAQANCAVFDTDSAIPGERFFAAVNTKLPADIRVTDSREVPADWHPRRQDCRKTYEYHIDPSYVEDPLKARYCMHWPRQMCLADMRKAAQYLVGEHDFTSFANPSSQILQEGGSAVRTLYAVEVIEKEDSRQKTGDPNDGRQPAVRPEIVIRVTGNGFLYNMVRIIAGTLMDVGTGRFAPEDIKTMLGARDRTKAGMTAQPKGLTLTEIVYPEDPAKNRTGDPAGAAPEVCF